MELRALGKDVYACLQEDRGLGTSNSGFINRGGGMVVDTFWDLPHTRSMIELYAGVWKEPARRVLNTHHNGDHCWGNQLFPQAEIVGHRLCAEFFRSEDPKAMESLPLLASHPDASLAAIGRAFAGWDFRGIELRPPTTLIDEQMDFDLDGILARAIYVGPAHTAGDTVVHLPESGIVFMGDVLFRLCTPIGWQGTYAKWIDALNRVAALAPAVVVPGHGPICGAEGLIEMRDYLAYARAEAKTFFDRGLSAIDAAKRIDIGPYANWTQPERVVFQIERAYHEFRGEPLDTPIEAAAMFRAMAEVRQERGW